MKNTNVISEIASAAAEYIHTCLSGHLNDEPAQWMAPIDDRHHAGMAFNAKESCLYLTVSREMNCSVVDFDPGYGAALLRLGFSTRLGSGLVPGISQDLGATLSLPVYTECDAVHLEAAVEFLMRELERLEDGPEDERVFPSLQDAMYVGTADASPQARQMFERLAASCGIDTLAGDARYFDVLFDDLPGRISLHPLNRHVVADFFLADTDSMDDMQSPVVIRNALSINQQTFAGLSYSIGLHGERILASTGRRALDMLDEDAWVGWLHYQVTQANDTRALIHQLGMDDLEIGFAVDMDNKIEAHQGE